MADEANQAQAPVDQAQQQAATSEQVPAQEFNQEAIDFFLANLEQECKDKGDAHAKKRLQDFGRQAKQVVADNTKNMTLAFEKEREMLGHLRAKDQQMQKGLLAIETHSSQFNT